MVAVGMVDDDSNDGTVTDADTKLETAEAAVREASGADNHADRSRRLGSLQGLLGERKSDRTEAMKTEADLAREAAVARGRSMYGALHGPNPGAIVPRTNTALNNVESDPSFVQADDVPDPRPLQVNAADGAGSLATGVDAGNVILGKGEPGGTVKGWKYRDYTHTAAATGTNRARVYSSRRAPAKKLLKDHFGDSSTRPSRVDGYTANTRTVDLDSAAHYGIKGNGFPQAGSVIYRETTPSGQQVKVRGTYDGAPGEYRCTPSSNEPCNAGSYPDRGEIGVSLSAGWTFVHDAGAMVDVLDNDYYYFGWWVREDGEGMPVAASAFWNQNGVRPVSSANQLTGSASYAGLAAGLYGVRSTLLNAEDGGSGDFTADVGLEAVFGSSGHVSGTVDNFRLNGGDEDPGWSVALEKTAWTTGGSILHGPNNTSWTIGDAKAPRSGTWKATVYDHEHLDGRTVPTEMGGTFYTEFEGTHRMVGAFGAKLVAE